MERLTARKELRHVRELFRRKTRNNLGSPEPYQGDDRRGLLGGHDEDAEAVCRAMIQAWISKSGKSGAVSG